MANPYSRSANTAFPNGPSQGTDNVGGLGSGAAAGLGAVGPASPLPAADYIIGPSKVTTGTGTSATGTLALYLIVSEDGGTTWTGGMNPAVTTNLTALNAWLAGSSNRGYVQQINANSDSTAYYFDSFNLSNLMSNIPSEWTLVLVNNSGAALPATSGSNHVFGYRVDTFQ